MKVTDYQFDSSAIEVVVLAVLRWLVLGAVLMRSRASLVRVKGDGTIKASVEVMVALITCAASAAYCVFKVQRDMCVSQLFRFWLAMCGLCRVSSCRASITA